jgi:hypothetical protein
MWVSGLLPMSEDYSGPLGSLDLNDPAPRILYRDRKLDSSGVRVVLWREFDDPATEEQIPISNIGAADWIEGERAILMVAGPDKQVYRYDVDTKELDQLSFDLGNKITARMWRAPEFRDRYVFFALIDDTEIGVYGKFQGVWRRFNTIKPPSVGNFIQSPEVLVYNGRSYIFMITSIDRFQGGNTGSTDIWLAGIDPAAPFYRKLSDETERSRTDPDVFITDSGAFIYFRGTFENGRGGIFRCDTGLGPPQGASTIRPIGFQAWPDDHQESDYSTDDLPSPI